MAKRCPPCDCPNVLPLWLGTYGDMVTLILTFFILLLSMVTFDAKKLSEAEGSFDGALSLLSGGIKIEVDNTRIQQQADITDEPETAEEAKKIESEILDFRENVKVSLGPSSVIDNGIEGFILRFHGKLLFKPNDYSITDADEILFLKRLALILQKIPPNTHMDIIGYTDDRVVEPTPQYQDNLGLSALRAASVSRILIQNNVKPQKITALGGGANNFIAPNTNDENRASNRRVEFRFYPDDRHLHKKQNILEKAIQQQENNIPINNPNEVL